MAAPAQATLAPITLPAAHAAPGITPPAPAPPLTQAPAVQLDHDDGLTARFALRQQFTKTNPKYAASFGAVAFERSTNSGLKLIGWRPINLVLQIWGKLEGSLSSLVTVQRADWEKRRPRHQSGERRSGSQVPLHVLRCFILGPDKEHATPHVAVLCGTSWFRKAVGNIITKSGLLESDGFKCFGLPDKPELYMGSAQASDMMDVVMGDTESEDPSGNSTAMTQRSAMQLYSATMTATDDTSAGTGYSSHSKSEVLGRLRDFEIRTPQHYESVNGMEIEVMLDQSVVGRATIGGVIKLGRSSWGMTVRHAFQDPNEQDSEESGQDSDSSDCEIDMFENEDEDSEYLEDIDEFASFETKRPWQAHGKEPEHPADPATQQLELVPFSTDLASFEPNLERRERYVLTTLEPRLDWALSMLPSDKVNEEFIIPHPWAGEDSIVMQTPSGMLVGSTVSSGILGIPMMPAPQPVLVASMRDIEPGHCGSWAMSAENGKFLGMLVGTCPSLGEAYLLRLNDILFDVVQHTKIEATVPKKTQLASPSIGHSIGPPLGGGAFYPQDQYFYEPTGRQIESYGQVGSVNGSMEPQVGGESQPDPLRASLALVGRNVPPGTGFQLPEQVGVSASTSGRDVRLRRTLAEISGILDNRNPRSSSS